MTDAKVPERLWFTPDDIEQMVDRYMADVQTAPDIEYVTAASRDAAVAEALASFIPHLAALPPGPWETWTSCSFRRISRSGRWGGDGDVLHAYSQRGDGHPDLSWTEEQCDAICAIVNGLRALAEKVRKRKDPDK